MSWPIPKFSLTSELRLGQDAHVDDVATPLAVHLALSSGRELRALHAHDGLARVELRLHAARDVVLALSGSLHDLAYACLEPVDELVGERIPEHGVRDDAGALEETGGTHALRAINDLVRKDEVARGELLAEGSYSGECENRADTEGLESCDIGA